MEEGITIFEIIKPVLFWVSPVIFVVGVFLLIAEVRLKRVEEALGKEIGGIKKRVMPQLETTIYTFHNTLLSKRLAVGVIFIFCSVFFFFFFRG